MTETDYFWNSAKTDPQPSRHGAMIEEFLVIRQNSSRIETELFWFGGGWEDGPPVIAWCRIPMEGIDEAVKDGNCKHP